jgi:hypothetical protein
LEGIFNSVMGPGAFTNLRNTGTKMLVENVLKGVGGKGKKPRGRPRKACMCGGSGGTLVGGAWYDCLPCFGRRRGQANFQQQADAAATPMTINPLFNNWVPAAAAAAAAPAPVRAAPSVGSRSASFIQDGYAVPIERTQIDPPQIFPSTIAGHFRVSHNGMIFDVPEESIYEVLEGINNPPVDFGLMQQATGNGRRVCKHKHPNKCKCPKMHGAGIFDAVGDYAKAWDLPGTGQKLANSALEILMKRALAGGAQPYNAPVMIGGRWTDYINPAWYFKKTMQKVVEPVLHATKLDKVVNAIPGVNMVAALTGATKPAGAGRGRRRGGAGLVDDLEGGAIPNFNNMSVAKLRQIYKALDDRPQPKGKAELIESISPFFDNGETAAQHRANIKKDVTAATKALRKMQAPKDAAYYRQRYARRKAAKEQEHVKEI